MNIGMMWMMVNKKLSLEEHIAQAKAYHEEKYGKAPTICEVNKSILSKRTEIHGVMTTPVRYVCPNLIWIGEK